MLWSLPPISVSFRTTREFRCNSFCVLTRYSELSSTAPQLLSAAPPNIPGRWFVGKQPSQNYLINPLNLAKMLHRHTCRHALALACSRRCTNKLANIKLAKMEGGRRVGFDPIRVRINPIPSFPFDDGFLIRATTMIFARVSIELAHPLI